MTLFCVSCGDDIYEEYIYTVGKRGVTLNIRLQWKCKITIEWYFNCKSVRNKAKEKSPKM